MEFSGQTLKKALGEEIADIGWTGGCFDPCLTVSVNLNEHSDPRGPIEVHWGLGYLSNLTKVVEEDVTTEDDTSSDESNSVGPETETACSGDEGDKVVVKPIFACTNMRYR